MDKLFKDLKANLRGDVHNDELRRKIYSVDASIFEVEPLGIVVPLDKNDLQIALSIAKQHRIPVTARGAATGITGGCLGKGLIIDTSKYMNNILEINIEQEYAVIEPGVIQDRLNEELAPHGYRLGPDTSTGNRATIGGMAANNAAGARSLFYGRMVDHVSEIELALAGGQLINFKELSWKEFFHKTTLNGIEGDIYRQIDSILKESGKAIVEHFPNIPRHVSGYNLDALLNKQSVNLSKLIVGSEGTLGVITKIKVKIAKKPRHTGICVIHVLDMIKGLYQIKKMLAFKPMALELIDDNILEGARHSPAVKNKLSWLQGNPTAVFVAEFEDATEEGVSKKLEDFESFVKTLNIGYAFTLLKDPKLISHVWEVRKAGLGLLLSKRSYNRAIAFIEDLSIAPEKLPSFMEEFCSYLKSVGKEAGIYGHIGSGCMHIRPYIDLRSQNELALMKKMMLHIAEMVSKYDGALSGEHGDGLIRSWLNEKMFGKEIFAAFNKVKKAFDSENLMNPGKIVGGPGVDENLRLSPNSKQVTIPTFLDFSGEGGFELAADLCNGNGQCRKAEAVMCPSFQATLDEFDTTRARAQSLRSIIHGKTPVEEFTGQALHDVMDLCIECKGCKRECPSQVDMAKMKSEFLYQYQEKHGYSFRSWIFANLHRLNRWSAPFATIYNLVMLSKPVKWLLESIGITSHRDLPKLAQQRFSTWFKEQQQSKKTKKIALFNDTYMEFNQPEIGRAAYIVLEKMGYEIVLVDGICCGRPLISKGFLKEAQKNAGEVIEKLYVLAKEDITIVGIEPSCVSAIMDDFKGLLGKTKWIEKYEVVFNHFVSIDVFLQSLIANGKFPFVVERGLKALVHTHCHQKALEGSLSTLAVLRAAGFNVHEIDSGCCGVAGSFGYEKEHYDISVKIGNLRLIPAIKRAAEDTLLVASGMSCRSQICHGSGRQAVHLIEAIASVLN